MERPDPAAGPLRLASLPGKTPLEFDLRPDAAGRAALAEALGITAIRKLRFHGRLLPESRSDWRLEAVLGATVEQPCVVTLAPVVTRIDGPVTRRYLASMPDPAPGETEMPEDETAEALPDSLDLRAVMGEALALALPVYPRAEGAALGPAVFTEPGAEPLTDEAMRPFAGLGALRTKLAKDGEEET